MIADDSESYPYLALARRLGVPYGRVLLRADACDGRKISEWSRLETEKLTEEEKWEVFCLWKSLETSGRKNYFVGRMVTEWSRPEWEEISRSDSSKHASISFYEAGSIAAYGILSLILLVFALVSLALYQGAFSILMFAASVGFAMFAVGRAIELRSGEKLTKEEK